MLCRLGALGPRQRLWLAPSLPPEFLPSLSPNLFLCLSPLPLSLLPTLFHRRHRQPAAQTRAAPGGLRAQAAPSLSETRAEAADMQPLTQ